MPTKILGIESTCDETGASVVVDGRRVLSNVVATQYELHERFRGVVPEIASRAHIENILPVIQQAMEKASLKLDEIDAVAVAHRPGLVGSLLIGVTAAKTLAWSLGKPLIGVDHVHAHLYSVRLDTKAAPEFPAIGLVASGGHTAIYLVKSWDDIKLVGTTIDDAVGEAYDKVAVMMGLGYPGGPIIDKLAGTGNPKAVNFPRSMLEKDSLNFSFSGLKTSVLYHLKEATAAKTEDVAASFQAACVDVIIRKLDRACEKHKAQSIIIGGGVSANQGLRTALSRNRIPIYFPKIEYCTDNAAMSAGLAYVAFKENRFSQLDLDAITFSRFKE